MSKNIDSLKINNLLSQLSKVPQSFEDVSSPSLHSNLILPVMSSKQKLHLTFFIFYSKKRYWYSVLLGILLLLIFSIPFLFNKAESFNSFFLYLFPNFFLESLPNLKQLNETIFFYSLWSMIFFALIFTFILPIVFYLYYAYFDYWLKLEKKIQSKFDVRKP